MTKNPVFEITVEDENGKEYSCQLSNPSVGTIEKCLGLIAPTIGAPKYISAGQIVLLECWVSGDEEIKKNEALSASVAMEAVKFIQLKKTKSKML